MKTKITALILAALLGLSLAACGSSPSPKKPPIPTVVPTDAGAADQAAGASDTKPAESAPQTEAPVIGSAEDYVVTDDEFTSLYSGVFTITGEDEYQKTHEVTDRLPRLTLDSEDARAINEQIHTDCDKEVEMIKENADSGYASRIDYVAYLNNSTLSLVIETRTVNTPVSSYYVYNIDVLSGKRISKDEIISLAGTAEDAVTQQISTDIENRFAEAMQNSPMLDESTTAEPKAKSLDPDNLAEAKLWFDGDGTLTAAYRYFWMAGAASYNAVCRIDAQIQ